MFGRKSKEKEETAPEFELDQAQEQIKDVLEYLQILTGRRRVSNARVGYMETTAD
jgi:hypothetical protein